MLLSNYKESRYNISVPLGLGKLLVYNSLSQGLSLLEARELEVLERVRAVTPLEAPGEQVDIMDQLLVNGFLVPVDVDERAKLEKMYLSERQKTDHLGITVLPTLGCNFGCRYCFEGRTKEGEFMPIAVQQSILKLIEEHAGRIRSLNITWFGGEPLLGAGVINTLSNRIVPFCDARGIAYYASLITNGYLLDLRTVEELYLRKVRTIQITLDGAKEAHDKSRFLRGSRAATYETIVENIAAYSREFPIATILRINIDRDNIGSVSGLIDDLAQRGLGGNDRVGIYFSRIEASTNACGRVAGSIVEMKEFAEFEVDVYKYAMAKGLCRNSLPYRMVGLCTANRPNGLVILPNGDIHRCWETVGDSSRKVGLLNGGGDVTRNDLEERWTNWSPFKEASCSDCAILPNCAGYCAYRFLYRDSFHGKYDTPCPALKYNIKEKLLHFVSAQDAEVAKAAMSRAMTVPDHPVAYAGSVAMPG